MSLCFIHYGICSPFSLKTSSHASNGSLAILLSVVRCTHFPYGLSFIHQYGLQVQSLPTPSCTFKTHVNGNMLCVQPLLPLFVLTGPLFHHRIKPYHRYRFDLIVHVTMCYIAYPFPLCSFISHMNQNMPHMHPSQPIILLIGLLLYARLNLDRQSRSLSTIQITIGWNALLHKGQLYNMHEWHVTMCIISLGN